MSATMSYLVIFFTSYNLENEAHESAVSIDYQLCNSVVDLAGVEYIQKYFDSVYFLK